MEKQNKSIFLLIMGIILTIFGGITLIPVLMMIPTLGLVISMFGTNVIPSIILSFVLVVLLLICGILGIVNHKRQGKVNINIILGVILLVCRVITLFLDKNLVEIEQTTLISSIIGVGLCFLYLLAAILFKRKPNKIESTSNEGI